MDSSNSEPRRAVTADEKDVYSGWRKLLCCFDRAGATKRVKRSTNRRERRELSADTITELRDYYDNHSTVDDMGSGVWER